ncbi:MAG: hypothetical protein Q7J15_12110 [Candidatus Desulfaltia sp.]|nr:hypothetical protein [Candidatus Desulfaltia sp.]
MDIRKSNILNYHTTLIISIIIGILLKYGDFSFNSLTQHSPNYEVLFSTIATILASLFALIFIILTIFIQLSNKYYSFELFMGRDMKIFMTVYFVTIITSLAMIQSGYYFPVLVFISATFCILSLYPFMYNINRKILYDVGVKNLGEEIAESIDSKEQASAVHRIEELGRLGEMTLHNNDSQNINNIAHILSKNLEVAGDNKLFRIVEAIGTQYIKIITQCSSETKEEIVCKMLSEISTYMSLYSSNIYYGTLEKQQGAIKNLGVRFIQDDFKDKYILLIEKSLYWGLESTHEHIWDFDENALSYLGDLAKQSFKKSLNKPLEEALACLWLIGFIIYTEIEDVDAEYKLESRLTRKEEKKFISRLNHLNRSLSINIDNLKSIEELCGNDEFENLYEKCQKSQILTWIINVDVHEFKEYYSQSSKKNN